MLHVDVDRESIMVPVRTDITQMFSDLQPINQDWAWLRHDPSTTLMLRNLGLDVPSPVLYHYDFPHPISKPPFEVQRDTVRMLTENRRAYVLSTMGVGKTVCVLWAFDYLKGLGFANKMLVVATLSTLRFTWQAEAFQFLPHLRVSVVYGTRQQRLDALAKDADIYVINHDGVKTVHKELEKRTDIDTLTLDELAVYRNPTDRSKYMQEYAQRFTWAWGLTGAPAPNQPTDVWGQARIITPNTVPKYFTRFRDALMVKINTFKYVPRHNAIEQAFAVLKPAVRYTLEDVVELPQYISRRVDVALGPKQQLVYDQIRQHCYAAIGAHTVTAVNAGAALNKMLQISLGWVYSNQQGAVITLDNQDRVQAILDIIASAEGKVIVFTAFKHSLKAIYDAIVADGWDTAPPISGDTSAGARGLVFNAFQNTPQFKVLPAHPQCMAHGITMTAADTIIWAGPITSLETYDQANARIRRVGQKRKQQFFHIQGTPAEKKMYTGLINKQDMQSQLLDMFRDQ